MINDLISFLNASPVNFLAVQTLAGDWSFLIYFAKSAEKPF